MTAVAPACFSTFAASLQVAPVVSTSSTSSTRAQAGGGVLADLEGASHIVEASSRW